MGQGYEIKKKETWVIVLCFDERISISSLNDEGIIERFFIVLDNSSVISKIPFIDSMSDISLYCK